MSEPTVQIPLKSLVAMTVGLVTGVKLAQDNVQRAQAELGDARMRHFYTDDLAEPEEEVFGG